MIKCKNLIFKLSTNLFWTQSAAAYNIFALVCTFYT